jgi:hypothetical protein
MVAELGSVKFALHADRYPFYEAPGAGRVLENLLYLRYQVNKINTHLQAISSVFSF